MARWNVYVPDSLAQRIREQVPGLNASAVMQEALQGRLACGHAVVSCTACAVPLDRQELAAAALAPVLGQAWEDLRNLAATGGTAVGAAQVVAARFREAGLAAAVPPLPRLTRSQRDALADLGPADRRVRARVERIARRDLAAAELGAAA